MSIETGIILLVISSTVLIVVMFFWLLSLIIGYKSRLVEAEQVILSIKYQVDVANEAGQAASMNLDSVIQYVQDNKLL